MPNSVTKRRTHVALLATVAMLASLFVFPLTAQAATGDVEMPADWSACVAAATADAGFADTGGSFADAEIDCIAHYGITTGTTATTYSPGQVVSRWQMALFLVRAAGPAGLTVPAPSDQGFTDIDGLPQATQDAINQIAAMGISKGTSTTTFSPNNPVSRYQMALFLNRFLDDAGVECDATCDDASGFTDTGSVSFEAYNAIEDVYDFGVTKGTTATLFSPYDVVTREQMAAFIARTLAHTNARPAGISFQISDTSIFAGEDVDVQISVRDSNFAPVVDALVDVFYADLADKADAVKADGTCDTTVVGPQFGGTECVIDFGEVNTNGSGNLEATLTEGADFSGSTVWWAWTGDVADTFDLDTTEVVSVEVVSSAAATHVLIDDNVNSNAVECDANSDGNLGWEEGGCVEFGDTVTHTWQLADGLDGDPVALSGEKLKLGFSTYIDDVWQGDTIVTLTTDANGTATYSWTFNDPDTDDDNATVVEWWVQDDGGYSVDDNTDPAFADDYVWEDDDSVASTVSVSSVNDYTVASSSGTGATNTVQATLTDQYGNGMSGKSVEFTSDDADGIGGTAILRTTNSSGVATLGYSRDSADSSAETVDADFGALNDDTVHYWVIEETDGAVVAATTILVDDLANDTLVVDNGADYVFVEYDANDQFNNGGAITLDDFEEGIDDGTWTDVAYTYQDSAAEVSSFTAS